MVPKLHSHSNDANNSCSTSQRGNIEAWLKGKQNQNTPLVKSTLNANLVVLCEEGKLNQVLELLCQCVVPYYSDTRAKLIIMLFFYRQGIYCCSWVKVPMWASLGMVLEGSMGVTVVGIQWPWLFICGGEFWEKFTIVWL